jgi:hypothetical protein
MGHEDCGGAGKPCENPDCPWWRGPKPAALVLDESFIDGPKKPN